MAFCPNCGGAVEGRFCAKCGSAVGAADPGAAAPGAASGFSSPAGASSYQAPPAAASAAGLSENVVGALCYLLGLVTGILFLVIAPYNTNKNVRFHAFQSIFMNVGLIVLAIVLTIIGAVLGSIIPVLGHLIVLLVDLVLWLGFFLLWLFMMFSTYQGKRVKLPVIGDLAEKQA